MFKTLRLAAVAALAGLTLTACAGTPAGTTPPAESPSASPDASQPAETFSIGITQIVTHEALDAAREGFKAALADAGLQVTYDEQNAQGDPSVAASIAGTFADGDYDLILAIATPTAQAVAQKITDVPVLFTAVTDPVGAELVASLEAPGANVTGTSDANPVKEQLELVKQIVPDAKTVGVVFNSGEANSVTQVNWLKEIAPTLGLEIKEAAAPTSADVQQATEALGDVDAIYVPTDNTVVSSLDGLIGVAEAKQIPVFGAEAGTVVGGAIATYGISYAELGRQTGEQAVRILTEGADPATMPVETQTNLEVYLNLGAAQRMGVTLPQELIDRAKPENVTQ
ncbi:MAG: ABC transporter substrate-binding protein [Actinobacteria bacterium]|nr:ABC transporter substrate-binding protein [Actinomycetota bacterium]